MSIIKSLDKLATGRQVLFLFGIYIIFAAFVLPSCEKRIHDAALNNSISVLDLSFGFSPAFAHETLSQMGESGRQIYLWVESTIDIIYPILYGVFFSALMLFLFRKSGQSISTPLKYLAFLPLLGMAFDWGENIGIILLIGGFPHFTESLALYTSNMGIVKWIFDVLSLGIIALGFLGWGKSALTSF